MKKTVICFLTVQPSNLFYEFCKTLSRQNTEIYICIDDNNYNIPDYDNEIPIIKLDGEICENDGFKDTVGYFRNKACSRDKALYYFCKIKTDYDQLWLIEEDVFLPTSDIIANIDKKYVDEDLLTSGHEITTLTNDDCWPWASVVKSQIKIDGPFRRSMICAIRVSKNLMNLIHDYANKYKTLFMDEVLFNTLAMQSNLVINVIPELSTILYKKNWQKWEIDKEKLYHHIKDINIQYEYRK